jgi:hypothetical protein
MSCLGSASSYVSHLAGSTVDQQLSNMNNDGLPGNLIHLNKSVGGSRRRRRGRRGTRMSMRKKYSKSRHRRKSMRRRKH